MKSSTARMMALTATAMLAAAPAALAGDYDPSLDVVIDVGDTGLLIEGDTVVVEHTIEDNPYHVVGFSFSGTFADENGFPGPDTNTWASDTMLTIMNPDGAAFDIGGWFGFGEDPEHQWDFQGFPSNESGLYEHGPMLESNGEPVFGNLGWPSAGTWTLTLTQTFTGGAPEIPVEWTGVTITLHRALVPGPGALAALAVAGVLGRRRRR